LVDGKCPYHAQPPEKVREKNYFFKLSKYLDRVRHLIEREEVAIRPASRKAEVLGFFKQGLEDFSVSREKVSWGIPLPFDQHQTTYVWVDALQNYISAIGYGDDRDQFARWWPADVHLMAREILKFHAIYWPALLLAAGLEPPTVVFAHGFFSLDGKKMSKSLGNVIDPNDMVQKFGVDATRYLLLSQFPFGQDGDIKESLFAEKYNADLANNLGNLVSRVLNMVERYCGGVTPPNVPPTVSLDGVGELVEQLEFDRALKSVWQAIAAANQAIDQAQPWKLATDESNRHQLNRVLGGLVSFLSDLGATLAPFMPSTAATIVGALAAPRITKGEPMFKRIQ
ncbi:MAG: class I tRNA ligase family protein, partial [Patescibacteria group bacterium]